MFLSSLLDNEKKANVFQFSAIIPIGNTLGKKVVYFHFKHYTHMMEEQCNISVK